MSLAKISLHYVGFLFMVSAIASFTFVFDVMLSPCYYFPVWEKYYWSVFPEVVPYDYILKGFSSYNFKG